MTKCIQNSLRFFTLIFPVKEGFGLGLRIGDDPFNVSSRYPLSASSAEQDVDKGAEESRD